jgi:hypothetical protein
VRRKSLHASATKNSISPQEESPYSDDGVDLTLIRWMLSLSPTERLQVLQQNIRSIMRLRGEKADTNFS